MGAWPHGGLGRVVLFETHRLMKNVPVSPVKVCADGAYEETPTTRCVSVSWAASFVRGRRPRGSQSTCQVWPERSSALMSCDFALFTAASTWASAS